ncbi:hypothetical protein ACSFC1_04950 [Pseudothermotoga sp. U03pept]|uniref:hypothetical protein n=1 Tax=Pseudothermotoga sp. U03pept TaxID=3447012 RepID=UPI003F017EE6
MKRFTLVLIVFLMVLSACSETQSTVPTTEDLAKGLVDAVEKLMKNDLSTISNYVKTTVQDQQLASKKQEYLDTLKQTFLTLGNKVEFLGIRETKVSTPVYSFDLYTDRPYSVENLYLMDVLFFETQGDTIISKKTFVLPFITLQGEKDKIYLSVIYKAGDEVKIFPKPLVP